MYDANANFGMGGEARGAKIALVVGALVIVVGITAGTFILGRTVQSRKIAQSEEVLENTDLGEIGSSREYDDNGALVAIHMRCSADGVDYNFYKEGDYEVVIDNKVEERGIYKISDEEKFALRAKKGEVGADFRDGKIRLGEKDYACREFNDA